MGLHYTLIFSLIAIASIWYVAEASRFGRNEARCAVVCSNKDSEECRICNTRIPMRFGKRSGDMSSPVAYLYDLEKMPKPNIRILALIGRGDLDSSYSEEN
ncbi:uncharacterized protein CDAR_42051 [Caerostris darwini]|uniref:Uncharacterized protein n=1 Tax=Caerostris darwini TaxID=1538125 RepID=A0AAV4RKF5_9ARAC|nr:uncharacterized protein CDAR_42051 [Caerostris darwini]